MMKLIVGCVKKKLKQKNVDQNVKKLGTHTWFPEKKEW